MNVANVTGPSQACHSNYQVHPNDGITAPTTVEFVLVARIRRTGQPS